MYRILTPNYDKHNPVQRWNLPDRVFFACGACHILAHAFLEKNGLESGKPVWIKPAPGHTGNHVYIDGGEWIFDYHGYTGKEKYLAHTFNKARHFWPGWNAELIEIKPEALTSEPLSKTYDGLWLMEPGQFLHNALPRARDYLSRFPDPV